MCGFAGVIHSQPDYSNNDSASRLQDSLFHRGPDDGGAYRSSDGKVTLISRRLAIIDLSPAGHMPMSNEDGTVWIAYNGEIYNFRDLRNDLRQRGHHFRSETDTEVIVHLYEEYGEHCVEHLRGMFAFAIWDAGKEQLFAARDRFGIKPLYYAKTEQGVSFASEIRALVAAGFVEPTPNWQALGAYLQLGSVPAPQTAVSGVLCLPPASWIIVRAGEVTLHRYWSLSFGGGERDEARAIRRTRELLEEAIGLHLISDAPLGIFLSGGLDSNTIAALAVASSTSKIRTLSVVFPEVAYSEAPAARAMARSLGTEHIELEVTADHVVEALDQFMLAIDQPTVDGMNTYFACEVAKQAGLKVALSGLGGDEVFGGYPSFQAVPLLATGLRMARALPGHNGFTAQARTMPHGNRARRLLDAITAPMPAWSAAYIAVRSIFPASQVRPFLRSPAAIKSTSLDRSTLSDRIDTWDDPLTAFDRVSDFELRGYMANQLLRDTDIFSMAHSIELRVPLLDHHLVEYIASLPGSHKRGKGKRLLRLAMQDRLPVESLVRRKQSFAFPWKPWLNGKLGDELRARVHEAYPVVQDMLCVGQIEGLWEGFRNGTVPWAQLWSVCVLTLWLARQRTAAIKVPLLVNR